MWNPFDRVLIQGIACRLSWTDWVSRHMYILGCVKSKQTWCDLWFTSLLSIAAKKEVSRNSMVPIAICTFVAFLHERVWSTVSQVHSRGPLALASRGTRAVNTWCTRTLPTLAQVGHAMRQVNECRSEWPCLLRVCTWCRSCPGSGSREDLARFSSPGCVSCYTPLEGGTFPIAVSALHFSGVQETILWCSLLAYVFGQTMEPWGSLTNKGNLGTTNSQNTFTGHR